MYFSIYFEEKLLREKLQSLIVAVISTVHFMDLESG